MAGILSRPAWSARAAAGAGPNLEVRRGALDDRASHARHAVEVEVEVSEPAKMTGVLPGTSADAEVILERREDALRIPAAAVAEGGKVLVLRDGMLEERAIEVGLRNWRFAEVLSGLAEGERVVTARNAPEIKAGARAQERQP